MAGVLACLTITTGLALGGSAFGSSLTIATVAGDGSSSFGGDNRLATLSSLNSPESVAATPDGGYLIADKENNRIRRVAPDGMIATVAGNGISGYNGDGMAALGTMLNKPEGVAPLLDGGFLIADTGNCRIRRVTPLGTILTVAGDGDCDYEGDGGLATDASLYAPRAAVPTPDGGFLIADTGNHVVRRVSLLAISTVAGTGVDGYDGDGGQATDALLDAPDDVALTADGGFLIADHDRDVIRKVLPLGAISTVAGEAPGPELKEPADVEPLADGSFLIADHGSQRVLKAGTDGSIVDFAGTGQGGFAGDGGPALSAELDGPHGLSIAPDGDVLIADAHNHRIRSVGESVSPVSPPNIQAPGVSPEHEGQPGTSPEPLLGESVVAAPSFGIVKVKLPGKDRWTLLRGGSSIPVGTLVNARRGTVVLTSAVTGHKASQTGTFWGGTFQVRQARGGNGMTDIVLRGGSFRKCRSATTARPRAAASRKRRLGRRLWGKDDHGRFRTHGRDSVATTRGTLWSTEDRCNGTLTRVRQGQVLVRRRNGRKGVLVSAGERYLAPSQP